MTESTAFANYADLNVRTAPLVQALIDNADALRIAVSHTADGVRLIDAGINVVGGLEAGRQVAEICMGGIGQVSLTCAPSRSPWNWQVNVSSMHPVLACLASQYAGWSLQAEEGDNKFFALGSGPARTLGSREPLLKELGYKPAPSPTCLVIESGTMPPAGLCKEIAEACGVAPADLTLIVAPTTSFVGAVQVCGRVLEVGLHKVHELHFPLERVLDGTGAAPVSPLSGNFLTAMGRTNDAIIFSGIVHLHVSGDDKDAEALANDLPSSASRDFGRPFAEIFKEYEYDFYKVDPALFSPAQVAVTAVESGRTFTAGQQHPELLARSFS